MNDNAIRRIQVGDLRKMSDREGLILQGCGGDPQEWLDGINEMLADAGILRNGSRRSEERRVGKECRSRWSPYH